MIIIWLIIGIAAVTAAFLVPSKSADVWQSLNASGIAAFVYLTALTVFAMRRPFPKKTIFITWVVFLVSSVVIFFAWTSMDATAHWQKDRLLEHRARIGHGHMMTEMPHLLYPVLKTYHQQNMQDKKSLGQTFQQLYPEGSIGQNIHKPAYELDSSMIFVAALSDSEVILIGQEAYVKGRNQNFKNFNGRIGMIQERAVLTMRGVNYESEN